MSTKINSFPGLNIGGATIIRLPLDTDVTVAASAYAASEQGVFLMFEFYPTPDNQYECPSY